MTEQSSEDRQAFKAVVLAAGEGTRMRSARPKVLHHVAGRSMVGHVLTALAAAGAADVSVVVGPDRDDVAAEVLAYAPHAHIHVQRERRGTAHAVLAAREDIGAGAADLVVAFGDTPLIYPETLARLRAQLHGDVAVAVLGFEAADPHGYGRLVRDGETLVAIREERDASPAERAIRLCNAGLMALSGAHAMSLLESIGNANAKGEFYLTDVVEIARARGLGCAVVVAPEDEVLGINDRLQLAAAEAALQARLRREAMLAGATLQAPETVFLSADTRLGRDVVVEPHVVFGPGVVVEDGAVIHAFSHLEGARLHRGAAIGPYARLRPGADVGEGARVGNFVELKNVSMGPGAKANHLAYLGDGSVGAGANIGAGTIFCNYDGFRKNRTTVGAGAFVGSNSALVAPVSIGDGAYVGTGSVVTDDVPADALAVARARQTVKADWAAAFRARQPALKGKSG
ncbi:bifunctional UDP-N-acetylglucosamine diphosphorylase/glucosamine-1-phosphate N-acetyltransferase GlmU [Chelatococcus reniformis]|uniref:Bifunctional protein GlmU n=1 Tax=Chelatococcus reniformis TaxID=1494448 RepID=A0A916X8V5_9HYPH|nr:bifunctional UDP-N-acetylglucosamine diphosphorylase/glucosamine-1-phosphate N-acetyltransferase GlmU [Chelatococcus reniformis]GGC55523.1 bifunctional protein GlmU [Chelatococcus reniformis]